MLEWLPPTNTGGPHVDISYYTVQIYSENHTDFQCLNECNVTSNRTTIYGLQYNVLYVASVNAYNCIGKSVSSLPVNITVTPSKIINYVTVKLV